MMIGISLSISNASLNQAAVANAPVNKLKSAIQSRRRVTAKINGKTAVIEPYALHRADGNTFLNAVVIYSEAKRVRKFKPQDFDLAALDKVTVTEDPFFPNWAFNADTIPPEIIIAVELVQYGQNAEQTDSSSNNG